VIKQNHVTFIFKEIWDSMWSERYSVIWWSKTTNWF